jgi:hypothetical protein
MYMANLSQKQGLFEFKNVVAEKIFGRRLDKAFKDNICVRCGKQINVMKIDELKVYEELGFCEKCQKELYEPTIKWYIEVKGLQEKEK